MENNLIETIKEKNKILKIYVDTFPISPRDETSYNLTKLILNHRRYDLPNELNINFDNFDSLENIKEHLKNEHKAVLIYTIRAYEHSGLSISLSNEYPFNDVWDSGVLGFIVVLKEDLIKEYKKLNKSTLQTAEKVLRSEFEVYKNYIEGEVYGYQFFELKKVKITKEYEDGKKEVIETEEEVLIDSCFGFFGNEGLENIKQEFKEMMKR